MRGFPGRILGLGIVLLAAACGDDVTGPQDPSELNFDPDLGVHLDQMTLTSMGLYYQDLVVGTGDPTEVGKMVSVHAPRRDEVRFFL